MAEFVPFNGSNRCPIQRQGPSGSVLWGQYTPGIYSSRSSPRSAKFAVFCRSSLKCVPLLDVLRTLHVSNAGTFGNASAITSSSSSGIVWDRGRFVCTQRPPFYRGMSATWLVPQERQSQSGPDTPVRSPRPTGQGASATELRLRPQVECPSTT